MMILLLAVVCIVPVMGVDTYEGGTPQISASISGVNEYSPVRTRT